MLPDDRHLHDELLRVGKELLRAAAEIRNANAARGRWGMCEDRSAATAPARAGMAQKLLAEAGGDPIRAEELRQDHLALMRLKSAEARRKRAGK